MGHGKSDRPFLSASEHSGVYGAHSASSGKHGGLQQAAFEPVAFDCCAISFQRWTSPVCSPDCGVALELTNLIPFLRKYRVHPVTGRPLELDDVVRLHFHTNEQGRYYDPVSFKEFSPHSHLVAIRPSGNVYLYDTVHRLNIKAKYMKDLVTDQPFTKADMITIHDPSQPDLRDPTSMHHVKHGLALTQADKGIDTTQQINTAATGSAQKVLAQLRTNPESESLSASASTPAQPAVSTAVSRNRAAGASTGMAAASFTSSSLTPRTAIERVVLDDEERMFEHVKTRARQKGYVRLTTNLGPLNLELHCGKAPRACYNFLQLCKQGKYDGTIFHRNIRGFMIQGGDPTGTGRGGTSIWGKPFRDEYGEVGAEKHSSRGVLSMANSGPGTNGSQFFITYRATPHLDGNHTVFGTLVDGDKDATLTKLEAVPSNEDDRPVRKIVVTDVLVTQDPFEVYQLRQKDAAKANDPTDPEFVRRLEKRRRRENDRTTWMGTKLAARNDDDDDANATEKAKEKKLLATGSSVGKYLTSNQPARPSADTSAQSSLKRKAPRGFGDFSSW